MVFIIIVGTLSFPMTGSSPAAEKPRDVPYSSGHKLHLQRLPIITSLRYRFFLAISAVVFVFLQFFFIIFNPPPFNRPRWNERLRGFV